MVNTVRVDPLENRQAMVHHRFPALFHRRLHQLRNFTRHIFPFLRSGGQVFCQPVEIGLLRFARNVAF